MSWTFNRVIVKHLGYTYEDPTMTRLMYLWGQLCSSERGGGHGSYNAQRHKSQHKILIWKLKARSLPCSGPTPGVHFLHATAFPSPQVLTPDPLRPLCALRSASPATRSPWMFARSLCCSWVCLSALLCPASDSASSVLGDFRKARLYPSITYRPYHPPTYRVQASGVQHICGVAPSLPPSALEHFHPVPFTG